VVREWIDLRTAQQQERLLARISASRRDALQRVQTRQRLQLAAPEAADRAQLAFDQAQSALAAPREAINASMQQLAVLQGVSEVETALGSVQQQRLREQHSLHAWKASQRVDQAVQTRAKLQLASPLERTESELGVDQAALDLADARAAHDLAYVALFKALGGAPLPAAGDPDEVQR
jgi:outer membrane protein TolC